MFRCLSTDQCYPYDLSLKSLLLLVGCRLVRPNKSQLIREHCKDIFKRLLNRPSLKTGFISHTTPKTLRCLLIFSSVSPDGLQVIDSGLFGSNS